MESFFSAAEARLVKPPPTAFPRCEACGLYKDCKSPKMPPAGRNRRRFLVVAESPAADDDANGEYFTSASGGWFARDLAAAGIDWERDCVVTYAARCRGGRAHKTAVDDCRPNVLKTISDHAPVAILLAGQAALKSVVGRAWKSDVGPVAKWTGRDVPCRDPNAWLFIVPAPEDVLRDRHPVVERQVGETLRRMAAVDGPPWPDGPPDEAKEIRLIHDPDEAAAWLRAVPDGATAAFDFETTTLKPDGPHAEIVCCGVCVNGADAVAFPWAGAARAAAAEFFENAAVSKIGYNVDFEDRWVRRKCGVRVNGWVWDGMLAAHANDPRKGGSGLKFQAFARLGAPDYNWHLDPFLHSAKKGCNEPNRVREIKLALLLKYCAIDALLEYRVAEDQMRETGVPAP